MRFGPHTRGFALVELAIAIAIIGLLLAAVLAAQELRRNSAVVATIAQVNAYGAATGAFLDRYGHLPGDLPRAASKIANCSLTVCEADPMATTTGDGSVGLPGRITRHQTGGSDPAERETLLFWAHLRLAEFISGVSGDWSAGSPALAWGESHPASPLGGGFHAKDADGRTVDPLPGWPPGGEQPSGTFLVLQPAVSEHLVPVAPGSQLLTPARAAQIDRKMDDGDPFDGEVVGYGTVTLMFSGAGCFRWTAVDRGRYDEDEKILNCGLAFRVGP